MSIPRLDPAETALLVIDVQERLMPTLATPEALAANCAVLLQMAEALELPAALTEQYPRGLGPTVETVLGQVTASTPRLEKTRFSALTEDVRAWLARTGRRTVLVCGIEAHVCVLQTVLDLQQGGFQAFVVTDAVSAGQPAQITPAFLRMRDAGAVLTGVLSCMYELMGDKQHPAFGRCLGLAKAVR
jgi:nicotinamidase-related amidase